MNSCTTRTTVAGFAQQIRLPKNSGGYPKNSGTM
jgi:hypothetical protein